MRLTSFEIILTIAFFIASIIWFTPLIGFVGAGILLGIFFGFKV